MMSLHRDRNTFRMALVFTVQIIETFAQSLRPAKFMPHPAHVDEVGVKIILYEATFINVQDVATSRVFIARDESETNSRFGSDCHITSHWPNTVALCIPGFDLRHWLIKISTANR